MNFVHKSVLLPETINWLLTDPSGIYVDCTLGGAGHSLALAQHLTPQGVLVGIDQDDDALAAAKARLKAAPCRIQVVKGNFKELKQILQALQIEQVSGILFDLGVSSYQLDTPERGFSYMQDGPLDMRMNQNGRLTAAQVVNTYSEERLTELIFKYGEERWSKRIAQFIVDARKEKPLATTLELVSVIKKAIPKGVRREGHHPAKKTFQALRIEVNDELNILGQVVEDAVGCLQSGGRLGVITFHSLEDRIAKQTLRLLATDCICPPDMPVCTCHHHAILKAKRQPILPSQEELDTNPRARSAKLRVGIRK